MTWKHPFPKNTITSVFGTTKNRTSPHRGTDYAPGVNTLIPAVTAGTVAVTAWSNCLGWYMVQTGSANGKTWYVGYCHLSCPEHGPDCSGPKQHPDGSNNFKNLKVGDKLKLGQAAGRVGNTGECSKGAHVHTTLGTTLKAVTSGKVYDLAKFIDDQASKPKAETCPTCHRPL
jgi:murein DD-endopeptidase MepM/ murein hydrolase activator NlpD